MTSPINASSNTSTHRMSSQDVIEYQSAKLNNCIKSLNNTNQCIPSCFSGLKNAVARLFNFFIQQIKGVKNHETESESLNHNINSINKLADSNESDFVFLEDSRPQNSLKAESITSSCENNKIKTPHEEKILRHLFNEKPHVMLILASDNDIARKGYSPFFKNTKTYNINDLTISSFQRSGVDHIGYLNIKNYTLTIGQNREVTQMCVVHVENWAKNTQLGSDEKEKFKQYLTQKIDEREVVFKSKNNTTMIEKPRERLLSASFSQPQNNCLYDVINEIKKSK